MITIGISDDHGASAAIMVDGEIKFAANEKIQELKMMQVL